MQKFPHALSMETGNPCRPTPPISRSRLDALGKVRHEAQTLATAGQQSRHLDAKLVEQGRGWVAVRGHPEFLLFGADVIAQIEVHMAFEVVHLVA